MMLVTIVSGSTRNALRCFKMRIISAGYLIFIAQTQNNRWYSHVQCERRILKVHPSNDFYKVHRPLLCRMQTATTWL